MTLILTIPGNPAPGANLPKLPYSYTALASDTFTGGDDTDIDGRSTDSDLGGSALTWESGPANSYAITSGKLVRGSANSGISGAALNVGAGDIRMTVDINALTSTNQFFDMRKAAPDLGGNITACYRLKVTSAGVVTVERKPVSGSAVTISTGSYTISAGSTVGLRIIGNELALFINGEEVELMTDASPLTGSYFEIYQGGGATCSLTSVLFETPSQVAGTTNITGGTSVHAHIRVEPGQHARPGRCCRWPTLKNANPITTASAVFLCLEKT